MASLRSNSAWVEIDVSALQTNLAVLARERPRGVKWIFVVKNDAYGHGMLEAARVALETDVSGFAVSNLDEAVALRDGGIKMPILVLCEPLCRDISVYMQYDLSLCSGTLEVIKCASQMAGQYGRSVRLEIEIDTGMSRFGVRWDQCAPVIELAMACPGVKIDGVFSHFVMSDELDKTFAGIQLNRFRDCLKEFHCRGITGIKHHMCNSGGFLDLPEAHFDLVRLGIIPWGAYPSRVCRRVPGLRSVMTVKSRIVSCRSIAKGDNVGYGLNFSAQIPMRVATIPIGYGDGFPRIRNCGYVLILGQRTPIIGRVAMDSMMVDVSRIPNARPEEEVVLMGNQGEESIDARELADLKGSTTYDVLCGWRHRLPRIHYVR